MMSFKMALRSIGSNKMRAMLTMLGIIIGVMALVVLVSLVSGATSSVTDAVSGLGSSMISVSVEDDKGVPVRMEDLNTWMDEEDLVGLMAPYATDSLTGMAKGESGSFTVYGTTPAYYEIQNMQLAMGRWLKQTDVDNSSYVCVLNEAAAEEIMGYVDCVGQAISLNNVKFTIVGVLSADDDTLTGMLTSGSMMAYIPYSSLTRLSTTVTEEITSFYVGAAAGHTLEEAETVMNDLLLTRFDQDEDAFDLSSQDMLEEAMNSITSVLSVMLGGIAAISLVVGGIGIMNIMLVTVTERTREIGIRKAIGASRQTILTQFLMEAVVLCMLGCGLGIFLSWAILQIVNTVVVSLNMVFTLDLGVVLVAVVFCFLIGVIFGLYPANKAAKMKPIDALHYGG